MSALHPNILLHFLHTLWLCQWCINAKHMKVFRLFSIFLTHELSFFCLFFFFFSKIVILLFCLVSPYFLSSLLPSVSFSLLLSSAFILYASNGYHESISMNLFSIHTEPRNKKIKGLLNQKPCLTHNLREMHLSAFLSVGIPFFNSDCINIVRCRS